MTVEISLFLYGPWAVGGAQYSLLKEYICSIQPAYILGQALCTEVGYPVLVLDGSDRIPGEKAMLRGPEILTRILDSMSNPFERVSQDVFDEAGQSLGQTQVYAVPKERRLPTWTVMTGGDWRVHMQNEKPLPERLTERQKDYLKRLGASSGRDIVPINLDLYQQLVKLGVVVDKGRRLALSSLGREVLRHLSLQKALPK